MDALLFNGYYYCLDSHDYSLYILLCNDRKSWRVTNRANTRDNKIIALRLSLLLITNLLSWLPFYYAVFSTQFSNQNERIDVITLQFVGIFSLPLNSALNPFLYTATNVSVLKRIIYCSCCKRSVIHVKSR